MESLFDFVRGYQDSHDCSDDDMIRILCDAVENGADDAAGSIEGGYKITEAIRNRLQD